MRRFVSEIRQYDYTSKDEFMKHREEMRSKGYVLIEDGMISRALEPTEIINGDKWTFSACFIKSKFM